MNQAFQLAQLQKIDTQLDQIQNKLIAIEQVLASNQALLLAQSDFDKTKAQRIQSQKALKDAEEAVQSLRIKIETSEAALYGGKIRNPKELQDLQSEIQSLKRRLAQLEDIQLEAMVALENAEQEEKNSSVFLRKVQSESASQMASLLGEQNQLKRAQERLATERETITPQITTENAQLYTRLREQKRGLAVCLVREGACEGCGTVLRPAEWQAARSPTIITRCGTCGRILYAG